MTQRSLPAAPSDLAQRYKSTRSWSKDDNEHSNDKHDDEGDDDERQRQRAKTRNKNKKTTNTNNGNSNRFLGGSVAPLLIDPDPPPRSP